MLHCATEEEENLEDSQTESFDSIVQKLLDAVFERAPVVDSVSNDSATNFRAIGCARFALISIRSTSAEFPSLHPPISVSYKKYSRAPARSNIKYTFF